MFGFILVTVFQCLFLSTLFTLYCFQYSFICTFILCVSIFKPLHNHIYHKSKRKYLVTPTWFENSRDVSPHSYSEYLCRIKPVNVTVDRIPVRISSFLLTDLELWFAQVETQFTLTGVTADDTSSTMWPDTSTQSTLLR